jgi:outer membrane protein TolC
VTRFVLIVGFLAMMPAYARAQEPQGAPLTLAAAVDLALRNHPAPREARASATAASQEIGVARTAYLPRLDLIWQANHATRNNVFGLLLPQFVVPPVSGPVLAEETLAGVWGSAGGLLLSWEPVDFGRRGAGVDVARAEATAADAARSLTDLDIAAVAADAFLAVLANEAIANAAQANVQRLETFANTVRALVENQLRPGVESSRANAEMAAARNRLEEAQRDAELARLTLADALGTPGVPAALDAGALSAVPPLPMEPAGANVSEHPRAVAARAQVDAARARDHMVDRALFPRVELQTAVSGRSVSENIDGTSAGSGFGLGVSNWAVGVSVAFPSMEIFRTQARRKVEAARIEAATAREARTVQTLKTERARARTVTAAAYRIAANVPQQLSAARETTVQASARYDAGLASVVEVAEAQRLLAQAESEVAVANLAVWRARLAEAILEGDLPSFVRQLGTPESTPNR